MGFFKKIIDGLKKTQQNIGFQIKKLFKVGIFNDDFYENLEEILLTSDVGAQATEEIVDNLKEKIRQTKTVDEENATRLLKEALSDVLGDEQFQTDYPCVILVVGVNGRGQDNHDRQACPQFCPRRQKRGSCRRGYLQSGSRRTA